MKTHSVKIKRTFNAPVEKVYTLLNDHPTLGKIYGFKMSRITDSKDAEKASGLFNENDDIIVENDIPDNEPIAEPNYPDSYTDDNSNTVKSEIQQPQGYKYEMPKSENPRVEEDFTSSVADDIPTDDFDPLQEKVKERDYTKESAPNRNIQNNGTIAPEPIIPEPINVISPDTDVNIGTEEIKQQPSSQPKKEPSAPKRENINPNLEDMSPSQKRKAAEQSADAILTAYGNLAPIPFKKMASFNLGKIDNLHLKGELDKNMVIADDGTTVGKYCHIVNGQVDATFEITKDMKDEIRPPLVEVLMENNLALTATQRLVVAVGQQVITMGLTAFQFMQQNKVALNEFKKFHNENKAAHAKIVQVNQPQPIRTEQVRREPVMEYKTEPVTYKTETEKRTEDVKHDDIPNETKANEALNNYIDKKDNSSGITVEEYTEEN